MLILQLIINGIIAGAIYALIAASFSIIFNILKFIDLSPGAIFVVAAFSAYTSHVIFGFSLLVSVIFALSLSALVSFLINELVYTPLVKRKADNLTLLLSSFGVFLFISSAILLIFGAEARTFNFEVKKGYEIASLGVTITNTQIILVLCSIILFGLLWVFMKKTKTGKALRAISDNKQISSTLGINVGYYTSITYIISAILAGIAGILIAIEQNLDYNMGFSVVIKGITASIIGGIGSVPAALVGGFLIGIVENLGIGFLPSGYKEGISFVLLILFLLFRPQGIFGIKTREEVSG